MKFLADESVERKVVERLTIVNGLFERVHGTVADNDCLLTICGLLGIMGAEADRICSAGFSNSAIWEGLLMKFVEPPKGQAKIVDLGESVRIEIPLRPHDIMGWFFLLFILVFFVLWVTMPLIGWIESASQSKGENPPIFFLLSFMLLWAIGAVFIGTLCLQMLMGREEILVTPQELSIKRRPFGKKLSYRLSEVKNLRVLEDLFSTGNDWLMWWVWWMVRGVLAFDYGMSTVRFGKGIEVAEARKIVALIKDRFGGYMKAGEE